MGPRSNPFRTRSIRGQIILLIAALALPLVGLQIWYGVREYREAEAAADDEALVLADATAASIRQFLTLTEEILSSIAADFGPAWMGGGPRAGPSRPAPRTTSPSWSTPRRSAATARSSVRPVR